VLLSTRSAGTVVYLGYGSLLQGQDRGATPEHSSVFTKLSYLWEI